MLTDHKINNHTPRQPFSRYSNIIYMLPVTQLQRMRRPRPPATLCHSW